mmetsp:Transcript_21030/g.52946  ORF Transcript_21030/g.52946 Transcript_21030/m.52946 type:complete len:505 (+) Transcript_21030:192-1706(+)
MRPPLARQVAPGASDLAVELGQDALAVRGAAQGGEVGADVLHQLAVQRARGDLQAGLHHVVAVRVLQQPRQLRALHHLAHNLLPDVAQLAAAQLEALLHHVGGELLHGQLRVVAEQLRHDLGAVLRLPQLQNVLHHVVAKWVLAQHQRAARDLRHEARLLRLGRKVDAALQHAAAVAVRGDLHRVRHGRVVDELRVLCAQALQAALDDVVAVKVLDEGDHPGAQRLDDDLHLLLSRQSLDELLHRAGAVRVERHADEVAFLRHTLQHLQALLLRAAVEQLLHEVVTKGVHHELHQVLQHLWQHNLDGFSFALVKLTLQEPAAVLVLRGLHQVAHHLLQRVVLAGEVGVIAVLVRVAAPAVAVAVVVVVVTPAATVVAAAAGRMIAAAMTSAAGRVAVAAAAAAPAAVTALVAAVAAVMVPVRVVFDVVIGAAWHPAAGAGAGRRSGSSGRGSRGDGSRVAGVVAALLNRSLRGSGGGGLQSFLALHVALHAEVLVHLIHLRVLG